MSWTCPYCGQPQPLTNPHTHNIRQSLGDESKYGKVGIIIEAISCANSDCREVSLRAWFGKGDYVSIGHVSRFELQKGAEYFRLRPSSLAKPQPPCVPEEIANDYYEACKIRDLSPKASATLSRRALQGMIRSFAGIERRTLFDEIEALEKLSEKGSAPAGVNGETIEAMHSLRKLGNIGAHMKANADTIIDVDPNEAQALIDLIEMLFEEWYVARDRRAEKLARIKKISEMKDQLATGVRSDPSSKDPE